MDKRPMTEASPRPRLLMPMRRGAVTIGCFGLLLVASCGTSDHSFSVRPVLAEFDVSPALMSPDGDHPPGLDPETGFSTSDDPEIALYSPSATDSGVGYHLGPAVLNASDFGGAESQTVDGYGPRGWWVIPNLTSAGEDKFRRITMELAGEPLESPTRKLAFVLDGEVVAAPVIAPDVDPLAGLDPDSLIISVVTEDVAIALVSTLSQ